MKKLLTLTLLGMFLLMFLSINVTAQFENQGNMPIDQNLTIVQLCDTCTTNNITSITFKGNLIIQGEQMTQNATQTTQFTYELNRDLITEDGTYWINGVGEEGIWAFSIDVTKLGRDLETGESIFYLAILTILILLWIPILWLALKVPYKNAEEIIRGKVFTTKVTLSKYVKLFSIWLSYAILLGIVAIISGMAQNYIGFLEIKNMLSNLYIFLNVLGYGVTTAMLWILFINVWKDIILNKTILNEGKAIFNQQK